MVFEMKKIILIVILIIFLSGCIERPSDNEGFFSILQELPSCGNEAALFTVSPLKVSEFAFLDPLGGSSPSSHVFPIDHMYFFINSDPQQASRVLDVRAPADGWVTRVWRASYGDTYNDDYSVFFSPCSDVELFFFHMTGVTDKLEKTLETPGRCHEYETGGRMHKTCEAQELIQVSAGEIIGTAGDEHRNQLDMGMMDMRVETPEMANPKRWEGRTEHIVCPVDYFVPEVRKELQAKIGNNQMGLGFVQKTDEPICGVYYHDKVGTAQGIWFLEGTKETYPEDEHLALYHNNIDHDLQLFSVGTSLGVVSGRYYYESQETGLVNRRFADVVPGEIYCFEAWTQFNKDIPHVFLMQMSEQGELKVEYVDTDNCEVSVNFENPVSFER